jgi:hypothetical protein
MSIQQYVAVEADNSDSALDSLNMFLEAQMTVSPWFEWYTISDDFYDPAFTTSPVLACSDMAEVEGFLDRVAAVRKTLISENLAKLSTSNMEKMLSEYDPYSSGANYDDLLLLYDIVESHLNRWSVNSVFYDSVDEDAGFQYFIERVKTSPERQYVVALDFRY